MDGIGERTIVEMTKRGLEKIEFTRAANRLADEQRRAAAVEAWKALRAEIRKAFPEFLREYVDLDDLRKESSEVLFAPPKNRSFWGKIYIPDFAPISVHVELDEQGNWLHVPANHVRGGAMSFYGVAQAQDDYEFGVIYAFRYYHALDELEIALATACEEGRTYRELVKIRMEREAVKAARMEEPVYEAVEEQVGLIRELVALVRDVIREEMDGRGE